MVLIASLHNNITSITKQAGHPNVCLHFIKHRVLLNFTESIVEPNQKKQAWYHQRFQRVPTIDQCYTDDAVCRFEADQQFRRDRMVENEIVSILRQRFEDCTLYEAPDHIKKCKPILEQYEKAAENWFIKCKCLKFMFIEIY